MKKRIIWSLILFFAMVFSLHAQQAVTKGYASYYGNRSHGRGTASGARMNKHAMICAHRTYPFGTKLLVRNTRNGKEVVVKVIDRGPYSRKFIIDLSVGAAKALGFYKKGVAPVEISVADDNTPYVEEIDSISKDGSASASKRTTKKSHYRKGSKHRHYSHGKSKYKKSSHSYSKKSGKKTSSKKTYYKKGKRK